MAKLGQYDVTKMNEQQVFDAAVEHLLTQGASAMDEKNKNCAYNGGDLCCAAAPFIPNYTPAMEEKTWRFLRGMSGNEGEGDLLVHLDIDGEVDRLIITLQQIHDASTVYSDREAWLAVVTEDLKKLAKLRRLKFQGEYL